MKILILAFTVLMVTIFFGRALDKKVDVLKDDEIFLTVTKNSVKDCNFIIADVPKFNGVYIATYLDKNGKDTGKPLKMIYLYDKKLAGEE